jgi:hypothetical protein
MRKSETVPGVDICVELYDDGFDFGGEEEVDRLTLILFSYCMLDFRRYKFDV